MLILSQNKRGIFDITGGSLVINGGNIALENKYFYGNIAKYFTSTEAEKVLADIIKKAEVGCNTYIMPEE